MTAIMSRREAEKAMAELAIAQAEQKALIGRRDEAIAAANSLHQPRIDQLTKDLAEGHDALQAWAVKNRQKEFHGEQSLDLPTGTLAFRKGNRALDLLNDKWDWRKVLDGLVGEAFSQNLRALFTGKRRFVRVKLEVDKAAILKESAGQVPALDGKGLAKMGVKVVQAEHFDIEFKVANTPRLVVT